MPAIETVYVDFRNSEGLRRDTEAARRDGFVGRLAIHPAQVPVINEVFTPTAAEIEKAKAIVAAFAAQPGAGAVGIDGKCTTGRISCGRRLCSRATNNDGLFLVDFLGIERLFRVAEFERHRAGLAERHRAVKARTPSGVTGARPLLVDLQPDRVLIAIDPQFDDALDVPGRLALLPQRLA